MFVKIAQAAVRQAKLATFSVETPSPAPLELFVYMTRLGSAQYAWSAWRSECLSEHRSARRVGRLLLLESLIT